jgi:rubrerythrin
MNEKFFNAFKTGIDKESEAIDFYRNLAKEADDIETKKLFEKFALEENHHMEKLMELYKKMKEQTEEPIK